MKNRYHGENLHTVPFELGVLVDGSIRVMQKREEMARRWHDPGYPDTEFTSICLLELISIENQKRGKEKRSYKCTSRGASSRDRQHPSSRCSANRVPARQWECPSSVAVVGFDGFLVFFGIDVLNWRAMVELWIILWGIASERSKEVWQHATQEPYIHAEANICDYFYLILIIRC